ncbi:MAG TPA: AAA family ATPase [Solirubrobacterales bacterium]|jgi:DNA-binding NarL/FixJ family response regulator|nr:AAA family ATPase [Solirubrobacterales bacterium]
MPEPRSLIGREEELGSLREKLRNALDGEGALVLVSGEAGVGKTRLLEELCAGAEVPVFRGAARQETTPAYGPVVAALRSALRADPDALGDCGPLGEHLHLLLPELGPAADDVDPTTLRESLRAALVSLAGDGGALVVLDDLQWSDAATLEFIAEVAPTLDGAPLLLVGAYRSDELPRDHPLRGTRNQLRRGHALEEVPLGRFDLDDTAALLDEALGSEVSRPLLRAVHDRSQGLPFFVEELARALETENRLQKGAAGLELAEGSDVTVPDTVRDAVLLRSAELSPEGRTAAEVAAVAGQRFPLEAVVGLSSEAGVGELLELGLVVDQGSGVGEFRHALVRESLYGDVPWLRRRELHRTLAGRLEAAGAPNVELAAQWMGARDEDRAREFYLRAAEDFAAVHACRDAATMSRRALELWPEGEALERRLATLEQHAGWAELAGDLPAAARSWREVSALCVDDVAELATAKRRLGRVFAIQGDRTGAIEALTGAAEAAAASGDPAGAAADRLRAADYLQFAGRHPESLELIRAAAGDAGDAGRVDLQARALAAEGVVRAKRGEYEPGVGLVKEGLSLALEHDLSAESIDAYQRLGTALEQSGDYSGAEAALTSALDLCDASGERNPEAGCVACLAYVVRELGEWKRASELSQELIAAHEGDGVRTVAEGVFGYVRAFRGELGRARRALSAGLQLARRLDVLSMQVDCAASLAVVADYDGDSELALEQCRFLVSRWERSEDHHYAVWGLRLSALLFAQAGAKADAHAAAQGLTRIADDSGHPDALAALAHALGEIALADGEAEIAAEQMMRAVELHGSLRIPAERAQILQRTGVALAAAGERELAIERHAEAYRIARNLGARPLAGRAATAIEDLGESAEQRLGRTATDGEGSPLSRRELEVIRLVADGLTNREIAGQLFLSPRTVDMHVRNILSKFDCRSRVEASIKAGEAGLLN